MQAPPHQGPPRQVPPPLGSAGGGPEKPQRQFSYEPEVQVPAPVRSQSRVRFQDPQEEAPAELVLRPSAVEQEFRRRLEQYQGDSEEEEEKVSTIRRNGHMAQSFEQTMRERQQMEEEEKRREAEMRIEEKRRELEETTQQEERLLEEARRRSQASLGTSPGHLSSQAGLGTSPPPLPSSPPPRETPPPAAPGTARLDMLLGGPVRRESGSSPSKRVSFMPPLAREEGDEDLEEEEGSDEELEDEMEEEQDPNAFINEAENLLNPGLDRLDLSGGVPGHTPSVIGTQEVYRDPRARMMLEKQEKKLSTERPPDGAKLSFKEKMKLFAQENGENTPRDKAKISKAQREIDNGE